MNLVFQCPKCKKILSNLNSCSSCSKIYFNKDGFYDFINTSQPTITSEKKLFNLLSKIHSNNYTEELHQFLKNNPEFEYRFNKMEGDVAFRVIRKNNARCLILNSDLGNIPETLSQVFDEVYSLETNKEKILIQQFRFKEKNIKNIVLVRSDIKPLPFPNNYFDLVVLDGIKIYKKNNNPRKKIIEFFEESKRVLTSDGCLCAGLRNKYGLKLKESGLDILNETFSTSFYGYKSILSSIGFKVDSYWAVPSHRKPHYSGRIEDSISLKWFFRNYEKKFSVDRKQFNIVELFLKNSNTITSKLLMKFFCPSFLFYCYKNEMPQVLEEMIREKTGFKNLIQHVRQRKVMYFLLDRYGNPRKVLSCKRMKYDLTEKIIPLKKIFNELEDPTEKIVIEDWVEGDVFDPFNVNDTLLALKWLVDFQDNTLSEPLSQQDIDDEITNLKNELCKIKEMNDLPYYKWLEDYGHHISGINLKKTAVHGDLQIRNILVDHNNMTVNVIDWDSRFQEKGNPIYDFMSLATNIMALSNDSIDEFRSNLNGTGKAVSTIKLIIKTMKEHFQAELDFLILLRFSILRLISIKFRLAPLGIMFYIELLKTLSGKQSLKF